MISIRPSRRRLRAIPLFLAGSLAGFVGSRGNAEDAAPPSAEPVSVESPAAPMPEEPEDVVATRRAVAERWARIDAYTWTAETDTRTPDGPLKVRETRAFLRPGFLSSELIVPEHPVESVRGSVVRTLVGSARAWQISSPAPGASSALAENLARTGRMTREQAERFVGGMEATRATFYDLARLRDAEVLPSDFLYMILPHDPFADFLPGTLAVARRDDEVLVLEGLARRSPTGADDGEPVRARIAIGRRDATLRLFEALDEDGEVVATVRVSSVKPSEDLAPADFEYEPDEGAVVADNTEVVIESRADKGDLRGVAAAYRRMKAGAHPDPAPAGAPAR